MRLPGFTGEAGLNHPTRRYNSAGTFTIAGSRTGVALANIIPGGCPPPWLPCNPQFSQMHCPSDVWDTCQYYASITGGVGQSAADVSDCCRYWVSCCEPHPPSQGGDGGGGGEVGGPRGPRGPEPF